jgi:cytochrome c-type biogenesis protein CcmF
MTVLGHWVVVLALVATGASAATYFRAASTSAASLALPRRFLVLGTLCLVLASILLLALLLTHDFSNGYVFSYSDKSLPLHYLLSTFYAGQEGSFLFWALCSAVIALLLLRHTRRRNDEPWVMAVYMAVQTMFLLLLVAKSPFRTIWDMFPEAQAGRLPFDGRGLNPLLQNFWMVIHPPILFIGFAAMAVPFSLAIGGLWKKEYSILISHGFSWILTATSILGLGIMLGAYWAYGVLGWGGYWGWDPVENSSLIPWLTGIALLHTMLAQLRTGKYIRTSFVLAIVSFFLVVYSTFLTRSGVLGDASVHSFTDPGSTVYWLLLVFLALIAVTGIAAMLLRRVDLKPVHTDTMLLSRETSLGAGSLALILSAIVILFGTSLPIFSATRVEPSFYDTTHLPIAIAIALLIGFSLYAQWEMQDGIDLLRRSVKSLAAAVLVTAVLFILGIRNALVLLFIFSSAFAFFVNAEIAVKVARGDWRFVGGKIAHMGLAIFLLGVISTGKFSTLERVALPMGSPKEVLGHVLTYEGEQKTADGKSVYRVLVDANGKQFELFPVMFDAGQQGRMRNPDIATSLTRDFYISPIDAMAAETTGDEESFTIQKGQTIAIGDFRATFVGFAMGQHDQSVMSGGGGMAVGSVLEIATGKDRERITPTVVYQEGQAPKVRPMPSRLMNANIAVVSMNVGMGASPSTITVGVKREKSRGGQGGTLVVEASIKPFINLVWVGTLVIMVGFFLSILKRSKEVKP